MDDQAVKVTRARMIIEFADGRATYYEARDPQTVEVEHLTDHYTGSEFDRLPADAVADWPATGRWISPQLRAAFRITGNDMWRVRIEQDSGELPPALAERALDWIEACPVALGPIRVLLPYLARIAGRQP